MIDEFARLAGDAVWPSWCLNNHDHSRAATRYDGGTGRGARRARLAAMMTVCLRGTPFLFQGEELGLPDARIPAGAAVDVGGRDPERAPVPWRPPSAAGPGAGFTAGEPWLPGTDAAEELNVLAQDADPRSTLALYRRLVWLRRGSAALAEGAQRRLEAGPDVLAFGREAPGERLVVALHFAAAPRPLPAVGTASARVLVSTDPDRAEGEAAVGGLVLGPEEGVVLALPIGSRAC